MTSTTPRDDEPELATKAPEVDAQEQEQGQEEKENAKEATKEEPAPPSYTEHCTTDRPISDGSSSCGELTKINEIDVYLSRPTDYPHTPAKVLLLLSNGSGIHSSNNQIQADTFARQGFLVVMPDQFSGDAAPNTGEIKGQTSETSTFMEQISLRAAETAKSFLIDMWLARQTQQKVLPILHKVVTGVQEEFADAVAYGGGIYAVGYCFGAKYALLLGSELPDTVLAGQKVIDEEAGVVKRQALIKTAVIAHGTMVTTTDFKSLKAPLYMACVENDPMFSDELKGDAEKILKESGVEHEIETFKDVPHGFAVYGEYADEHIQTQQGVVFEKMVEWLKRH